MTKIEQVARELCRTDHFHRRIEDLPAIERDKYMRMARAAIAAMREPTPEMIKAGFIATRYDAGYGSREDVFRAMIDQVLADGGNN